MIVFIRCRHTFSYGAQPWEYKDFEFEEGETEEVIGEEIRQFIEYEFYNEYAYAEKRHTVEWNRVTAPPVEWLRAEIETSAELIDYNQWRKETLEKTIQECQVPPKYLTGQELTTPVKET